MVSPCADAVSAINILFRTLEHTVLDGAAALHLVGERGGAGRSLASGDGTLARHHAADGAAVGVQVAIEGHTRVDLRIAADGDAAGHFAVSAGADTRTVLLAEGVDLCVSVNGDAAGHIAAVAGTDACTVTFMYDGEVFCTQTVQSGTCASMPSLMPEKEGRWDYDFTKPVEQDIVIKWK